MASVIACATPPDMNRLWLQLSLGFALVVLVSTLTVGLLVNYLAGTTFRGYVAQNQVLESGIVADLAAHYATYGSLAGAEPLLTVTHGQGQGQGQGQGRGLGATMGTSLVLADHDGQVLADPAELVAGSMLSAREQADAIPILFQDQPVGYLLVLPARGAALPLAAQRFLDTLNQVLWITGWLAGVLGLALGLLIARSLAAPLAHLAAGARRIAAGQLTERVPISGPAEVQTVATAFNEMASAIERGEAERRNMVADIAHELRTPLTVLQGNLRAMLDDVYPLTKEEVALIYEAGQGLRRLVDDLRELSLAEAGRLALRPQALAVVPLLEREVALFADFAAAQGVALSVEAPPDLPAALADPDRLGQILHNLISNALRHTPSGGSITLRAARLEASAPGVLRFEVVDTGEGIAAEALPHLFERFYRADRGRAREAGGTGLGLAITSQLVRLHGGTIGVSSLPMQGTRFWFTLPVAEGLSH